MTKSKPSALLPLKKINFIIMGAAVAMIIVGFALIAGGNTDDGSFNPEIFSTRRLVIGPALAFLGFVVMGAGIMWPSRKKADSTEPDSEQPQDKA